VGPDVGKLGPYRLPRQARHGRRALAALPIEFDANPLLLNVINGTLVFLRPEPERGFDAAWSIREHRREDRITKVCGVAHDPRAKCPRFDAFLAKVQPDDDMRGFLDIWSGYNALGLADAQKFAIFYGEGSNGKGVWVNTIAHILGDYAWATGIETFIDQGRYRKGSDASPTSPRSPVGAWSMPTSPRRIRNSATG
jgi:putative DNA primase/helicase